MLVWCKKSSPIFVRIRSFLSAVRTEFCISGNFCSLHGTQNTTAGATAKNVETFFVIRQTNAGIVFNNNREFYSFVTSTLYILSFFNNAIPAIQDGHLNKILNYN